jgi:hypothetical protein
MWHCPGAAERRRNLCIVRTAVKRENARLGPLTIEFRFVTFCVIVREFHGVCARLTGRTQ